jgi:hypothetical protein
MSICSAIMDDLKQFVKDVNYDGGDNYTLHVESSQHAVLKQNNKPIISLNEHTDIYSSVIEKLSKIVVKSSSIVIIPYDNTHNTKSSKRERVGSDVKSEGYRFIFRYNDNEKVLEFKENGSVKFSDLFNHCIDLLKSKVVEDIDKFKTISNLVDKELTTADVLDYISKV